LFLSNAVRMHRALRRASVPAALHIQEAGPHASFPGTDEEREFDREIRLFLRDSWDAART
jgi:hypothetical protein